MATLDQAYFAREIKMAFQTRSDNEQAKKQNFIEVDKAMLELITTSHYLAKGKPGNSITVTCRFEGQSYSITRQKL